ncbi:MAG TPA: glycosyltransferase [Candidatus Hydrogenedentes bacterium]|nr:glycosyltransferase [Candidatus Hydrogenedentota bacterium]
MMFGLDPSRVRQACICSCSRGETFLKAVSAFRRSGAQVWIVDMKRAVSPYSDIHAISETRKILRANRFDVVHAHSSKAGLVGRIAAWLEGIGPVLYSPHAYAYLAGGVKAQAYFLAEMALRPLTDLVVTVSDSETKCAQKLGFQERKIATVYNGVRDLMLPSGTRTRRGRRVIGSVTGLRPQKDTDTLLRSLGILKQWGLEADLVVCGEGPQLPMLKRIARRMNIENSVEFAGWVQDVPRRLATWDLFVLATHYEGLSYALLEAMAAGKPIVASRVSGVEEVLVHGECGLLVRPDCPEELAEAIRRLLDDPVLSRRLGMAARRRAAERYGLDRQLEQLTILYQQLRDKKSIHGSCQTTM